MFFFNKRCLEIICKKILEFSFYYFAELYATIKLLNL